MFFASSLILASLFLIAIFVQHNKLSGYVELNKNSQQLTLQVQKQKIQNCLYVSDNIKFANTADVLSLFNAKILSINAKQNSIIKKGDVIFTIQLRDLQEEIKKETQERENKTLTLNTNQKLYEQKMISKAEYIESVKNYELSQKKLDALLSKNNTIEITSQFDGYIEKIYPQENEVIFTDQTKLFTIKLQDKFYFETILTKQQKQQINTLNEVDVEINHNEIQIQLQGLIEQIKNVNQNQVKITIAINQNSKDYQLFKNIVTSDSEFNIKTCFKSIMQDAYLISLDSVFLNEKNKFAIKYLDAKNNIIEQEIKILNIKDKNFVYIIFDQTKKTSMPENINIL